ncbi:MULTISPECIES: DUF4956 domain-containing protein [Romboutsia]|uniref:Tubulin/FtsZ, GTPase n=1 Tax=Romboutsia hominis TaxID=1507512 RepID=A0A2P2BSH2_9FIRM|nr:MULTISPECIES: DUF4956 domain-containing protein [Romboutsia]MDB8791004.1 DUF4956 domain-containing protein [Romboutsia sp. 1001216sp1]MDB8801553.1 DUF4956 domain-containing protein [Romboutsia sp. 1001216sp1]MDB8804190.1 DUF4956 domain-containing protein [Romboutsia sp. 1001216sp1]MDB8808611.1 DUF4956 domain-containing protein [Romboutsia sp. 1001216sp1]MDB8809836.1 DUF4956 domain-containing protein [Romboutsia sp. 1001216sp1]
MKETLYKYLTAPSGNINLFSAIEMMSMAFILSMVIFWTYKITFSGVMYNRKFNVSLVMLTLVTTMVMIVIGSDIALSLGMVGALSIVRFRTAIKDPRDTGYIFWCIAIGLSVGSQNYMIAIVGSLFLFIVLSMFSFSGIGKEERYILIIRGEREREEEIMRCVFDSFKGSQLRAKNSVGNNIEIIYQIKFKNSNDKNILDNLYKIEGVSAVNLVAQNGETIG